MRNDVAIAQQSRSRLGRIAIHDPHVARRVGNGDPLAFGQAIARFTRAPP